MKILGYDMCTGTLCGRSPIKNLVPMCHYFLSMGGNVTKIGLYVYITKIFEFECDRFYRYFLCNFKEYS